MTAIDDLLTDVMAIAGALSVALVDSSSGLVVAASGDQGPDQWDEDAADATDIVRVVLASPAFTTPKGGGDIEDVIVSAAGAYHLLTLINASADGQLFLHVRLDRQKGNLALARHRLQALVPGTAFP